MNITSAGNSNYKPETNHQAPIETSSPLPKKDVLIANQLPEPTTLALFHVFEDVSKYNRVMNLLVEHGYLQSGTYIWKDENKGYKGLLAALVKFLHHQGYYKKDTVLTPTLIHAIVKNTFGRTLALITIKKAKPEDYNLTFIPPASTFS